MDKEFITLTELTIKPETLYLYVPPIVWKGDSIGHIGKRDLFFWVIEGECFLRIDNQSYIVRPGQLGITDTSYFTRMFKKHCNVTPSVYRAEFKSER